MSYTWNSKCTDLLIPKLIEFANRIHELAINSNATEEELIKQEIERIHDKEFKAAVSALMKCGKSTLLNAILRGTYLPEDILPATSSLVTIYTDSSIDEPCLYHHDRLLVRGREVFSFLEALNSHFRYKNRKNKPKSYQEHYKGIHFEDDMLNLSLHANIHALSERVNLLDNIKFLLMDTPGVDEPIPAVLNAVNKLLREADVIIYLLDISKLSSNDEINYLSQIVSKRPDIILQGRCYFLLNKIDLIEYDEDKIEEAKELILRMLNDIDENLALRAQDKFYALSTRDYLLSIEGLNGMLSTEQESTLRKLLFGVGRSGKNKILNEHVQDMEDMMHDSGFPIVEQVIFDELCLNAPKIFGEAVIGNLLRYVMAMKENIVIRLNIAQEDTEKAKMVMSNLDNCSSRLLESNNMIKESINELKMDIIQRLNSSVPTAQENMIRKIKSSIQSSGLIKTYEKKEDAERGKALIENIISNEILNGLSLLKANMDMYCLEKIRNMVHLIDSTTKQRVIDIILESVTGILPPEKVQHMKESLSQSLDIDIQIGDWNDIASFVVQVEIRKKKIDVEIEVPTLIPAEFEEYEEVYEGGGGGGGEATPGMDPISGAKVGSLLGPIGAVGGFIAGGLLSVFGGGKPTTRTVVKRQREVKPAKIKMEPKTEKRDAFEIIEQQILPEIENHCIGQCNSYVESFNTSLVQTFNRINDCIQRQYIIKLESITNDLKNDIASTERDLGQKERLIQSLNGLRNETDSLIALLSQDIAVIIQQ